MPNKSVASTRRGTTIYLHLLNFKGGTFTLPNIPAKVISATALTGGKASVKQDGENFLVTVPASDCQEIDTLIKLELGSPAMDISALRTAPAVKATASNVFQKMDEFGAEAAFDGDSETRWATDSGTKTAWVALDLGKATMIRKVQIKEAYAGRVQKFEFQYQAGGDWTTIFTGNTLGEDFSKTFTPVEARAIRLNILDATEGPTIWEIQAE